MALYYTHMKIKRIIIKIISPDHFPRCKDAPVIAFPFTNHSYHKLSTTIFSILNTIILNKLCSVSLVIKSKVGSFLFLFFYFYVYYFDLIQHT